MDEYTVVLKARELIRELKIDQIPVDLTKYTNNFNIQCEVRFDLPDQEAGEIFPFKGGFKLLVNGNHTKGKQRFTIAHEVVHILLELSISEEERIILSSELNCYTGKSKEEFLCDLCARELLMPMDFIRKDIENMEIGFHYIEKLASKYLTSLTSTGFRYAEFNLYNCAFILSEKGFIRYVKGSPDFISKGNFIKIGRKVDPYTYAYDLFRHKTEEMETQYVKAIGWLDSFNGVQDYVKEESKYLSEWDQVLSLIWFDIGEEEEEDNEGLDELDGYLRFRKR